MSVPKFDEIMLPLLKLHSDKKEHHRKEFLDALMQEFKLSEEDRNSEIRP